MFGTAGCGVGDIVPGGYGAMVPDDINNAFETMRGGEPVRSVVFW
jgi:hypothetical protein